MHIAANIVIPTIADVPVVPKTEIGVVVIVGGTVEELVVHKYGIVQSLIIWGIKGIHHRMNLNANLSSSRFKVIIKTVIENKEQALVALDVGIVAIGRVVMSVTIHVYKRRKVFGIARIAMGWPS